MSPTSPIRLLLLSVALGSGCAASVAAEEPAADAILDTYADIALAAFEDSLATAKSLDAAADALIADPSEETLAAARGAWKAARIPYQQTEAFRFGNAIVDEWEGRVNAWPLDEGLIDYVAASYGSESDENGLYTANVIANPTILVDGIELDAGEITPALLKDALQEAGGIEANVATGYHAIEFLLWGQDLSGTGPGAGARLATDYSSAEHADRRAAYLDAATDLQPHQSRCGFPVVCSNGGLRESLALRHNPAWPGCARSADMHKSLTAALVITLGAASLWPSNSTSDSTTT